MKDASTTYLPFPNEPRKPGFIKDDNILLKLTIKDRFTPVVKKVQHAFSIFEWKHFPSEQNSLIGLA